MTENTRTFRIDTPPVFADEIFISERIKVSKTKRTAGFMRLQFTDMTTSRIVADVTVDAVTCEGLINILTKKLKEMDKLIKSKDPEKELKKMKQQPVKVSNKEETEYTG